MANSVIGALRVMLGMDTAEFEAGTDRAEREARRLQRSMERTGRQLAGVGRNLTIALTAPLVAFGVSSFTAASDAAELQSAFDQTFGEMAGDMNRWAEEAGNAMGRSTQSMQQLANTFGIFFNQAAGTREEAARMSQTFAVLAQDLASFYNVAEEDALQKLRSGLSGEAEPLRDFGVFLSAAAVEARALEMGLAGASGEITEQDKILARYNLILEATTNAQGDVARTADGTANQMRRAQAAFDELRVAIGTRLLPAITPLIERIGTLLDRFANLSPTTQTAIVAFAGIAAALGPVLMGVGGLIQLIGPALTGIAAMVGAATAAGGGFAGLLAALGPVLPVLAAVAGAAALIYANWDTIGPLLNDLWSTMQQTLGPPLRELVANLSSTFSELWNGPLGTGIRGAGAALVEFHAVFLRVFGAATIEALALVLRAFGEVVARIGSGVSAVNAMLTGDWSSAWQLALRAVEAFVPGASALVGLLVANIRNSISGVVQTFEWLLGKIGDVEAGFAWLYDRVVGNSWIPDMVDEIGQHIARLSAVMVDPALRAAQDTSSAFEQANAAIASSFDTMVTGALGSMDRLLRGIKSGSVLDIVGGLLGGLQSIGVLAPPSQAGVPAGSAIGGGIPGFANGGAMRIGGFAGIDRNLLSLNGSPIARVSAGETMRISPANDRGRLNVTVTMDASTGALGAFVRDEAGNVVAQAAPALAQAGSDMAMSRMARLQSKRFA